MLSARLASPAPDWLPGLHPLFNAEEIDDLGEKIFSFETKTLVMPDRTKIHWTLLWRTLISTRHSVRLIIINIGSQNNNKGPMTRTDHSPALMLCPQVSSSVDHLSLMIGARIVTIVTSIENVCLCHKYILISINTHTGHSEQQVQL